MGAEKTEEVLTWSADLDNPTVTLWAVSTDSLARPWPTSRTSWK